MHSSIYRYLSAIINGMRVRTRKWERLYRMRAQSEVYRFVFLVQELYFIFFSYLFFLFQIIITFETAICVSLINGIYAFRKGEKKSRISCDLISNRPKRSAVDERKRTRNFQRGTRYESNFTFRTRIRSSIFEGKIVILVETCLLFELNVEVLDRDI